ncbi:MAG: sodium/proton antiporter NhaB [Gammaproteobacteria bacterium]|nr:sodium/proton antiporter NhaB [Gammaproteobacteria bacterium]MDH3374136.1 sodium/proton antiporter NhaB [Gammaproteobacteria bacterium]MDH3409939.1 sodium/proton antiporter NhaB [Gammaproteobacteria bacterium]MDH3552684.1 sodium/proton antiporter NhaB [Gammaproteobacteria bacterium]
MPHTTAGALRANFLGNSPVWYKQTIIAFLILNPILAVYDPFLAGWVLVLEFIFTLAMALKCYPLQPGGLLAVEAIVLGLATPEMVFHEAEVNFPVIMLLMFMVAGIYFLREMLLYTFTKILLGVRSKILLSVLFSFTAAFLSAFLDALTVTAVIITVAAGFYGVYHKVASGKKLDLDHDPSTDVEVAELHREDLIRFRTFLRNLMMHGAVGTALGGVTTLVGEPQNLLIAEIMGWEFMEFFWKMAHISMPVLVVGLATCVLLEVTGTFGYGAQLTPKVREVLEEYDREMTAKRTKAESMVIAVQAIVGIILVIVLGNHLAEPGVVGLLVIVLATALNGVTEEHRIGHAFEEALPFTALLVVFFAIVAVIDNQGLFTPVIDWVMTYDGKTQEALFFMANGVLSMISDNVFVATVYITEVQELFLSGEITREQFDQLAIAINTGTNIPSVATPNGQAAFLFLLTSALAPLIRLSYGRMVIMALPYTITMSIAGLAALWYLG